MNQVVSVNHTQVHLILNRHTSQSILSPALFGIKSIQRMLQTQLHHAKDDPQAEKNTRKSTQSSGPLSWTFSIKNKTHLPHIASSKSPPLSSLPSTSVTNNEKNLQKESTVVPPEKWSKYSLPPGERLRQLEQDRAEKGFNSARPNSTREDAPVPEKKRPKRRLQPRKALITLSPNAIVHLKQLFEGPDHKLVRIGVRNRGCSGLTYDLQYITEPGKFDEVIEQDGVKIVIDSKALFSIVGSEMDWLDDKLSSRFIFKNPNSKGTCGCGESFMV